MFMLTTNTVEALELGARGNPLSSAKWRSAPSLPSANRTSVAVTSLPDGAGCVLVGGFSSSPTGFRYLADAWHFDGTKYTRLPNLPYNRSNMGITATSAGVYVIGGSAHAPAYYNVSFLARAGEGDDERARWASSWAAAAPLQRARAFAMVGALSSAADGEEQIVAAGGMSLNPMFQPMGSVEVYSPKADAWTLHDDAAVIGGPHAEGFGPGDLVTTAHGALFYLGDTVKGATLVRLNLTDGTELCSAPVALKEVGFVGLGQSLDYDAGSDTLLLSGLAVGNTTQHAVYRAPANACGPFTHVASFGDATYVPMLHASAFDATGGRLFLTVGIGKNVGAVAVVDLKTGGKMRTIAEVPGTGKSLVCMHWDPKTKRVIGVVGVGQSLQLHSLDPDGKGQWDAAKEIVNAPKTWSVLGGNDATESAFDPESRALFLMVGSNKPPYDLATIDVDAAVVVAHPPLASVGIKGCNTCVSALTL